MTSLRLIRKSWLSVLAIIVSGPILSARGLGPTVDRASILITVRKINCAFPGGQRDENQFSWIPMMNFKVNGPIASGTVFTVEYVLPGGNPWISFDLESEKLDSNGWYVFDRAGKEIGDPQGTMETGLVTFTISMRNRSDGTSATVLFSGRFTVKKYNFSSYPEDKNKFDFYVDQDWRLPIAVLSGDWWKWQTGSALANPTPDVLATVWLHGKKTLKTKAYLYYQGKQILSVDGRPRDDASTAERSTHNLTSFTFELHAFWFNRADNPASYPEFDLSRNPGDYQIQIVVDEQPIRVVDFKIGSDGKLVDNGFAGQANLRYSWLFPAKITGFTEIGINRDAYKTEAFYGNPLFGFTVPSN